MVDVKVRAPAEQPKSAEIIILNDIKKNESTAYEAAIQMIMSSNGVNWASFAAILSANMGIIAFVGVLFTLFKESYLANLFSLILCVLGLFICFIWYAINRRHRAYHDFWYAWARETEKIALGTTLAMLQVGRSFGDGIPIKFDHEDKPHIMPSFKILGPFNRSRVGNLTTYIIIIVGIIYIGAFLSIIFYPENREDQRSKQVEAPASPKAARTAAAGLMQAKPDSVHSALPSP